MGVGVRVPAADVHECEFLHGACERPDTIELLRRRHFAVARHEQGLDLGVGILQGSGAHTSSLAQPALLVPSRV